MPTINKPQKKPYHKKTRDQYERGSAPYYNSHKWKKLRNWHIMNNPLCVDCMAKGISTPAEEVHHRVPFLTGTTDNERWRLLLDDSNLVSLCRDCHHERHRLMRKEE